MSPRTDALVAPTSIGLGHAARSVALARGLQDAVEGLYPFFLAGGAGVDFVAANGFDVMPIPPAPEFPVRDGRLRGVWRWYLGYGLHHLTTARFLRREVPWRSYAFALVDGELPVAQEALRAGRPTVLVVHRLNQRFAQGPLDRLVEGIGNGVYRRLLRRTDLVLALEPVEGAPDNVRYVGPIARRPSRPREVLRDAFFFRKKTVLVAPGGSAMGRFLAERAAEATARLGREDIQLIVVTGPKVRVREDLPGFRYGFVPNLHDMIAAADLVVTLAGKTTVAEARVAGTPVIAIPVDGHAEQVRNAARLGYRPEDIHRLEELIAAKVDAPRPEPVADGLEVAVRHILELLELRKVA